MNGCQRYWQEWLVCLVAICSLVRLINNEPLMERTGVKRIVKDQIQQAKMFLPNACRSSLAGVSPSDGQVWPRHRHPPVTPNSPQALNSALTCLENLYLHLKQMDVMCWLNLESWDTFIFVQYPTYKYVLWSTDRCVYFERICTACRGSELDKREVQRERLCTCMEDTDIREVLLVHIELSQPCANATVPSLLVMFVDRTINDELEWSSTRESMIWSWPT